MLMARVTTREQGDVPGPEATGNNKNVQKQDWKDGHPQ